MFALWIPWQFDLTFWINYFITSLVPMLKLTNASSDICTALKMIKKVCQNLARAKWHCIVGYEVLETNFPSVLVINIFCYEFKTSHLFLIKPNWICNDFLHCFEATSVHICLIFLIARCVVFRIIFFALHMSMWPRIDVYVWKNLILFFIFSAGGNFVLWIKYSTVAIRFNSHIVYLFYFQCVDKNIDLKSNWWMMEFSLRQKRTIYAIFRAV